MIRMTVLSTSSLEHGLAGKRLRVDDEEGEHSGGGVRSKKKNCVPSASSAQPPSQEMHDPQTGVKLAPLD